jgi:hypothetical protein
LKSSPTIILKLSPQGDTVYHFELTEIQDGLLLRASRTASQNHDASPPYHIISTASSATADLKSKFIPYRERERDKRRLGWLSANRHIRLRIGTLLNSEVFKIDSTTTRMDNYDEMGHLLVSFGGKLTVFRIKILKKRGHQVSFSSSRSMTTVLHLGDEQDRTVLWRFHTYTCHNWYELVLQWVNMRRLPRVNSSLLNITS